MRKKNLLRPEKSDLALKTLLDDVTTSATRLRDGQIRPPAREITRHFVLTPVCGRKRFTVGKLAISLTNL